MPKTLHRNEVVRITDLATTSDYLDDREFEGCEIVGPAILVPLTDVSFDHNTFDGSLEGVLWRLETGREHILGAIGLRRVTFHDCRFRRIGIAGDEQFCLEFNFGTAVPPPDA